MSEVDADDVARRELDLRVGFGLFASEVQLGSLVAIARRVDVEVGQVLYARGEPSTTLFQIVGGEVELQTPGSPAWRVGERGVVGLIDFAIGRVHARTATVVIPAQLLEVDAADYRDYLEDNYEVAFRIVSQLSSRLIAELVASPLGLPLLAPDGPHEVRTFTDVEIPLVERLIMLSRMPPFRGTSMQALANLAELAVERRFAAGEVIAAAGTVYGVVSLLVEGTVELELPGGSVRRDGRDFVAHVEELAAGPRLATAKATSDVIVLQLERDDLIDRIEEHFDLGMTLLAFVVSEQERVNDASASRTCRLA